VKHGRGECLFEVRPVLIVDFPRPSASIASAEIY
jgi:hypothetical protein